MKIIHTQTWLHRSQCRELLPLYLSGLMHTRSALSHTVKLNCGFIADRSDAQSHHFEPGTLSKLDAWLTNRDSKVVGRDWDQMSNLSFPGKDHPPLPSHFPLTITPINLFSISVSSQPPNSLSLSTNVPKKQTYFKFNSTCLKKEKRRKRNKHLPDNHTVGNDLNLNTTILTFLFIICM